MMLLSAWLLVVIVGLTVMLSIGGMLLVRRWIPLAVLQSHNEVAGFIYAVVGVVYAVLLAFTAIVVWEQHTHAESVAAQEASELATSIGMPRHFLKKPASCCVARFAPIRKSSWNESGPPWPGAR
jgi:hypothetical protein